MPLVWRNSPDEEDVSWVLGPSLQSFAVRIRMDQTVDIMDWWERGDQRWIGSEGGQFGSTKVRTGQVARYVGPTRQGTSLLKSPASVFGIIVVDPLEESRWRDVMIPDHQGATHQVEQFCARFPLNAMVVNHQASMPAEKGKSLASRFCFRCRVGRVGENTDFIAGRLKSFSHAENICTGGVSKGERRN